jgi:hypothetical protein
MAPVLQELFVAARGPLNGRVVDVRQPVDLHQLGHFSGDGLTFVAIKAEIEKAAEIGGWIVWMIHGVGSDTHRLYIETGEHKKLVQWLGMNKELVWTAPLVNVAQHVAHQQA